jgi:Flp pilus assembly protein TadD
MHSGIWTDNRRRLFSKGIALEDLGKNDEAMQAFDSAIQLDPQNAAAWGDKGYALESLGKTTEAAAAYAKAKELNNTGPA